MSGANESRPLAELIGGLASDISNLFRKEVQLAKAEASEKISETMAGASSIAIGAGLALGALGVLLTAIVTLVAALLIMQGVDPVFANTIAAFIVAIVVGIAAWVSIQRGLASFKATNLNMNRTAASLGRDADIVKERL